MSHTRGRAGGRLGRGFFARYTPTVAKELLGCRLVRMSGKDRLSGEIVETEAYRGARDPASHAFRGMTGRNAVMFGPPGHAYVYFTMGKHFCLNITTEPAGAASAVLIRAARPLEGIQTMQGNRGGAEARRVASGPGNLARALGIDRALNGEDMVNSTTLFLERGGKASLVGTSTRVGVSAGASFRWRFFVVGSPFVSNGRPSVAQNP